MSRRLPVVALTAALVFGCLPAPCGAEGTWSVLEDPPLAIRYTEGHRATAAEILTRAGDLLTDSGTVLGLAPRGKLTIVLADSEEQFSRLQPGRLPAPEWAGALAYPSLNTVLLKTPSLMRISGSPYWSLLQHEMVHMVVGEAELARGVFFPKWFSEGLATYISGEMRLPRLLTLGWAQVTGAAPSFRELEDHFPQDPTRAEAAYARSYLFIKYIASRFGDGAVASLLESSLRTGTVPAGVEDAFGVSYADVMKGFMQYSRVKATWIPAITSTASLWMVITMLFLVAYMRKKIDGMRKLSRWREEEELLDRTLEDDANGGFEDEQDVPPTLH